MSNPFLRSITISLILLLAGRLVENLSAAEVYWDINGSTAGAGGTAPAGAWSVMDSSWATDSTGSSATAAWTSGNSAVFSAGTDASGAFVITNADVTVDNLTQEEGRIRITGSTLTLADSQTTVDTQNRISGDYDMRIDSDISGAGATISKSGPGILLITGNKTYTGNITLNEGTLAVEAGNNKANNALGTGTLTLNGGSFVRNWDAVTTRNTLVVNGSVNVGIIQNNPDWTISGTWEAGSTSGNFNVSNAAINGFNPQAATLFITGDLSRYTGVISHKAGNNRLRFGPTNAGQVTLDASNARFFTSGATSGSANPLDVADGTYGTFQMGELAGTGGIIRGGWSAGGNTTFEVGATGGSSKFAGSLQDNPNGGNGLTALKKTGTGALELSGTNNTYSLGTTVEQGTLLADASANSSTASGPVAVGGSGTLGGTGRIVPGGDGSVLLAGVLAPGGSVSATTGGSFVTSIGTLTIDQSSSSAPVLQFAGGGIAAFELDIAAGDKVVIVGKAGVSEVVFNNTVVTFTDLSGGALGNSEHVLFQGDSNTDYLGLETDAGGRITSGLTMGAGLSGYPLAYLSVSGNNIVLNTAPPLVPEAPANPTAIPGYNQIALSWTASAGATGYNVYRSTTSGSGYTILMGGVSGTSFTDTSVVNGTTYYYVVSAVNGSGESAQSTPSSGASSNLAVGINFQTATAGAMVLGDLAGAVRAANWNNMIGASGTGITSTLSVVADSNGAVVGGMSVSFTGGRSTAGTFANSGTFTNDAALFNGIYDQFDGSASSVTVTGIPYATYDVYFYRHSDNGTHGGSFTIGGTTYFVRGGTGNPSGSGTGYACSSDTTLGAGNDVDQGNCVKFTGLSGSSFTCTFTAINAGDSVQRSKVPGFQIVATSGEAPVTSAPPAPGSVFFVPGDNRVTLSWKASNTATSHLVQRSTDGTNWTTVATLGTFSATTFTDATAVNGTPYFYKVTAVNGIGQTDSTQVSVTPFDPAGVRTIGVTLTSDGGGGMAVTDLAGVVRVPCWNNLGGLRITGSPYSNTLLHDNTNAVVAGAGMTYTRGNGGGTFVGGQTSELLGNDVTLFANGVDQFNAGTPGVVTISGIPYASYDVYVFDYDNGSTHGGSVKVNGVTKFVRGGAGIPDNTGLGYVESDDTTFGNGTDIQQGNFVRFPVQTGSACTIELNAVNCGDGAVQRFRPCAVQIVSNQTVPVTPPTVVPGVPDGITAAASNRQVGVRWNATATATSYKVKRSTSGEGGFSTIATVTAPTTACVDRTAVNGTTFHYVVSAVNEIGESADSVPISAQSSLPAWTPLDRSVYQWSIPVIPRTAKYAPTADPQRRAYLWIPSGCTMVRGIVTALQNMIERPLLEDPAFRQMCAEANLGIVWIAPGYATGVATAEVDPAGRPNMAMTLDPGLASGDVIPSGERTIDEAAANDLAAILDELAAESGHAEVQYAPLAQVGHSAGSPFAWGRSVYASGRLAGRVFALLPYKGTYPGQCPKDIPILHVSNQWAENGVGWGESWYGDRYTITNFRGQSAETDAGPGNSLVGEFTQPGVGHYQHSYEQVGPMALFIKKAAQYRIPSSFDGTAVPVLNTIAPSSGCLVDPGVVNPVTGEYGTLTPTPYATRVGAGKDAKTAWWYLDEELAQAVCDTMNAGFSKKMQVIAPVYDNGSLGNVGPSALGTPQYYATLQPDGQTFQVRATFLTQSPTRYVAHGDYLGFSATPIFFRENRSGGLRQTGADTFVMHPDRGSVSAQGQPWDCFFLAMNLGDSTYRSADKPVQILNSLNNLSGTDQTIAFPDIPNQLATDLGQLRLNATASSGLPVKYWMVSGPYRNDATDSSTLVPDALPAVAAYPMRAIVAAWQWGRPGSPQVRSAGPVFKIFWVHKNALEAWRYSNFGTMYTGSDGQLHWSLSGSASDTAAPAGDGIPNLLKYATGQSSFASATPPITQSTTEDGTRLTLTFNRIADSGLTYTVEGTDDLTGTWTPVWSSTGSSNVDGPVTVPDDTPIGGQAKRFLRLKVSH